MPPAFIRLSWRPLSATWPSDSTRMRSQSITLESRCAKMSVVRPRIRRSSALWITASFSASTADSASSKHQDRRIAQDGARDRDALALAARQLDTALADHRVVAVGQGRDEIVDVGGRRGGADVVVARVGPAHADVGLDRAVEQEGVLVDDRDHAADLLERQLAQVVAAEADRALNRIVEAQQQADDRRLAAARRADHADALAGRHRER